PGAAPGAVAQDAARIAPASAVPCFVACLKTPSFFTLSPRFDLSFLPSRLAAPRSFGDGAALTDRMASKSPSPPGRGGVDARLALRSVSHAVDATLPRPTCPDCGRSPRPDAPARTASRPLDRAARGAVDRAPTDRASGRTAAGGGS